MNILDLPSEVLLVCLSYSRGTDVLNISQTCKLLNNLSETESLWKAASQREFGLDPRTALPCSFKYFYSKVLLRHGGIIGLWRNSTTCYGGLVHVWFTEKGTILAEELIPQEIVTENMSKKSLFHIKVCDNEDIEVKRLLEFRGKHTMEIIPDITGTFDTTDLCSFATLYKPIQDQEESQDNGEAEKTTFFNESRLQGTDPGLCSYKWDTLLRHYKTQRYERIESSKCRHVDNVPIQPGFFKGMYGGHGTEVLHLYYDSNKPFGLVRKMSGDPNVPSGEISISFDMNKHMKLTRDQQLSLRDLEKISDEPSSETYCPYDPKKPCSQPFVCSRGAFMHGEVDDNIIPDRCIARFHALGTVSPMGYTRPTKIPTHFIVFNENLFGVIWLQLYSFSVFSRVTEEFPALR
ncbi:F-box only protein 31 [Mactra antiquata]